MSPRIRRREPMPRTRLTPRSSRCAEHWPSLLRFGGDVPPSGSAFHIAPDLPLNGCRRRTITRRARKGTRLGSWPAAASLPNHTSSQICVATEEARGMWSPSALGGTRGAHRETASALGPVRAHGQGCPRGRRSPSLRRARPAGSGRGELIVDVDREIARVLADSGCSLRRVGDRGVTRPAPSSGLLVACGVIGSVFDGVLK
jgi:hypothetical protein